MILGEAGILVQADWIVDLELIRTNISFAILKREERNVNGRRYICLTSRTAIVFQSSAKRSLCTCLNRPRSKSPRTVRGSLFKMCIYTWKLAGSSRDGLN
ncbi:prostasin-like [Platysternon megacephalum]|uniref:Prostasin-like n=1 Tax=Platysternon megacephalum TaxID=55544 RepID=A0A4D9DWV6_9SAUR|nr:prostasin-like [Platysternon megacephalum]